MHTFSHSHYSHTHTLHHNNTVQPQTSSRHMHILNHIVPCSPENVYLQLSHTHFIQVTTIRNCMHSHINQTHRATYDHSYAHTHSLPPRHILTFLIMHMCSPACRQNTASHTLHNHSSHMHTHWHTRNQGTGTSTHGHQSTDAQMQGLEL